MAMTCCDPGSSNMQHNYIIKYKRTVAHFFPSCSSNLTFQSSILSLTRAFMGAMYTTWPHGGYNQSLMETQVGVLWLEEYKQQQYQQHICMLEHLQAAQ